MLMILCASSRRVQTSTTIASSKKRTYFDRPAALGNADYRALFDIDRHGALRELRRLVDLKVLASRGADAAPVTCSPSPPSDDLRSFTSHVRGT